MIYAVSHSLSQCHVNARSAFECETGALQSPIDSTKLCDINLFSLILWSLLLFWLFVGAYTNTPPHIHTNTCTKFLLHTECCLTAESYSQSNECNARTHAQIPDLSNLHGWQQSNVSSMTFREQQTLDADVRTNVNNTN